ncbi:hypothetical protein RFI_07509 [Reticulomyxa filosa]|uniref:EF-hand domain-containing protein n=1 Tax=Reticulomyxa filosa TaxID=46433 RepID=X6NTJ8_RETFI|nr:hypothetical protein RFI_07509 [Reticulomyxa filosa]|eukprot:ETO29610.1 hypothetical protein RFI_07509 [Reticulomyxa filosa]
MGNLESCFRLGSSKKEKLLPKEASEQHVDLTSKPASLSVDNEDAHEFDEFRHTIAQAFWAFSGYSKFKKTNIYLQQNEISKFLEICNITEPSKETIFREMDSEIVDNQISYSEFVNYFCDPNTNPGCYSLQKYMKQQTSFQILKEALRILEMCNSLPEESSGIPHANTSAPKNAKSEFTGRITYKKFQKFAEELLHLDTNQAEQLWHQIDTDDSGDIRVDELFDWLKSQLLRKQIEKDEITGTLTINQQQS